MSHGLEHKFEMVSTTFRYQCKCANGEIITLTVAVEERTFDRKELFFAMLERAYLDLQGEIEAHVKAPTRAGELQASPEGQHHEPS